MVVNVLMFRLMRLFYAVLAVGSAGAWYSLTLTRLFAAGAGMLGILSSGYNVRKICRIWV